MADNRPQRISDIFLRMAETARLFRSPSPVIETDIESAQILAVALCADLGCLLTDLRGCEGWPHIIEYDGVKVVARPVPPRDLYREHFGPLVDIWG